jgi:uncharacterized membrane protein YdjX (TVP38/TMEM64 family)
MSHQTVSAAIAARALKPVLMAGALVLIAFALPLLGTSTAESTLTELVTHGGIRGPAMFMILSTALMAFGLPRQIPAFVAGYAFGAWHGTMIALVAQICACGIDFAWARAIGRDFVRRHFGTALQKIDIALNAQPFFATLSLRLLPVGSNLLLNLAAGLTSVRALPFLTASVIGFMPQTIIFSLIGRGSVPSHAYVLIIGIGLFAVSTIIGLLLFRRSQCIATPATSGAQ